MVPSNACRPDSGWCQRPSACGSGPLCARDQDHLQVSLEDFAGGRAYGTPHLCDDLARFIFLLGGSDGEPLFDPEQE
jgi:hypothetical protein